MLFGNPSNTVMQYLVEKNPVLIVYNVLNIFRAIVFYIIFPNKMVNEPLNKRRKWECLIYF